MIVNFKFKSSLEGEYKFIALIIEIPIKVEIYALDTPKGQYYTLIIRDTLYETVIYTSIALDIPFVRVERRLKEMLLRYFLREYTTIEELTFEYEDIIISIINKIGKFDE